MKKIIMIILFLFFLSFLSGCGKGKNEYKEIKDEQIFMMEEDAYYIYFFREDCSGCETTTPIVNFYLETIRNDKSGIYKNMRNIYGVCLEKDGEKSKIYRKYNGDKGDGTNGAYKVNGVLEWDKLYIASTPSLIAIYEEGGVRRAKYLAQGSSAVVEFLENALLKG